MLLHLAGDLTATDARLRPLLTPGALAAAVTAVPDEWLGGEELFPDLASHRRAYLAYLETRLAGAERWVGEAVEAQRRGPIPHAPRLTHRVV